MRSSHSLVRLETAFDDDRLVADAGLLLPATLAQHLGLRELVERHLDLGDKPGHANRGDKFLTLVMSALAGGTEQVFGFVVKAASTLGTFLRSFTGATCASSMRCPAISSGEPGREPVP